jgi:hypothetical protein
MEKLLKGLALLLFTILSFTLNGQSFSLSDNGNTIVVKGTSSLHDWVMEMANMDCKVNLILEGSRLKDIGEIKFSGKAKELKSESNLMDKKAYSALQSDKFPEIKFIKTSLTGLLSENNKFSGKLAGDLSVAGETRRVNFPFTGTMGSNRTIDINGEIELKMSDFKIDPPTAMLGTLKTGDAISVSFTLRLIPE